uniref:E3 ubiquitin-protein ligase LRSAM1-like n=1 Tax=Sinocyclocheilus rhinocerous TaxID=307959 RepID=A0A673K5N3_9TELE
MFLFSKKKKPSEDSIKRLEYQLCLAKEAGADDILDISACELTEVPSSAFSICKVLQKKVLILHGNGLRSLVPKGCCIGALATLKVLDLHENKLTSLPDDIGQLLSLQVYLFLTVIPVSVGRMSSLRTLDISENSIRELPKELASVRTLEVNVGAYLYNLILDAQVMSYPPASVCTAGTEEVQCYLCSEMGLEYCPPSQYLLPVLEHDRGKQEVDCVDGEEKAWQIKFMDYEKRKEQKQLEKLIFEKDFEEKQREHTQLFLLNNSRKEDVLLSVKLVNILIVELQKQSVVQYVFFFAPERSLFGQCCIYLIIIYLNIEVLADQRTVLTDLLQQLLKQKDQREEELRMVLVEMDQKSESNQQNYWMIQYQRLLDAKPLSLRMQEAAVDGDLGNLLCKLSAQHYLPVIAHHRITAEALRHMTTKDLRKLGINEVGVQKALLHWKQEAGPSTPSAPLQQQLTPPLTPNTPLTPTAPSPDRFSSSECVVCMEHESQVIFLPCGHVCCCQTCSNALQSCPLCRGSISQRVRLYHG